SPLAAIASMISGHFMGLPASARTLAAASRQPSRLGLAGGFAFAGLVRATFCALAGFAAFFALLRSAVAPWGASMPACVAASGLLRSFSLAAFGVLMVCLGLGRAIAVIV